MSGTRTPGDHAVVELVNLADRAEALGETTERRRFVTRATELLVERGDVDAAIQLALSKNEPELGATIAEEAGDDRRAAQLFGEVGDDVRAAKARERSGEPSLAAEHWERAGHFDKAGALFEAQGDFVRASKLYERAGEKKRAADLLVRALSGAGTRRLLGAEAQEACRQAGALYADAGHVDLAVRVLKWGGQMVFAGQLLTREGRHDDAIDLLVESGDLLAAAEAARRAGDEHRAHVLLAERAEKDGRLKEAAEHLEEAGAFQKAGHLYELAEDLGRAASAFERAEQFESAAQLYERVGKPEAAARCLRAAGRSSDARAVEARTKSDDSIEQLVERQELLAAANSALALARAGDRERYADAIAFLEKVPSDHADDVAARTLLAEVLAESGDPKRALNVLQRMFVGTRPTKVHVPAMYQYGRLLEHEGYLAGARNAYRTAAAFDSDYRDLVARLSRLKEDDAAVTPQPVEVAAPRAIPTLPMVIGGPRIPRAMSSIEHLIPVPTAADLSQPASTMALIDQELRTLTGDFRIEAPPDARPGARATPLPDLFASTPTPTPEVEPDILDPEDVVEVLEEKPSETTTARPDALVGIVLRGRFRIEKKLGRGAQAQVYLARDQVLDRAVAIKVLNEAVAEDEAALDRFLREARLAARVHHVGCLAIYDFGQEHGLTFMAMEYFKGRTLRDLVKRGPMDTYLALRIANDVAAALAAVHESGIIHRDVKPTNVMVDRAGNVRLTDFGVARVRSDESSSGMMVGTMKYMAPEQARGKASDHRADIFSFGVVLYEMLSGKPPFGGTLDALIARVTKPPPSLPEEIEVPEDVVKIVTKCMQRKPSSRYRHVNQLLDALGAALTKAKAERKKAPVQSDGAPRVLRDDESEDPTQDGVPSVL